MKKHTPIRILRPCTYMILCSILLLAVWNTTLYAQTNSSKAEKEKAEMAEAKIEIERQYEKAEKWRKEDLEKVRKELEKAQIQLQKKDWSKIESEMQAVKEKLEHAMLEVQKTMEKTEIEKTIREVEENLLLQKGKIQEQLKQAEKELEKTKADLDFLTKGIDLLEKDGLIKRNDSIKIEWEGDFMILNGKKLSKKASDKYKPYFKRNETL